MSPIVDTLTAADLATLATCPTTGLTTRPAGQLWADRTTANGWGAIMIDIDGLKAVNDLIGHVAGDALLRLAAEIVTATVRADDAVVIRWGGDEMVVLLPGAATIVPVVARLRDALDGRLGARASVGGSVSRWLPDAIADADAAMYAAKHARRGQ